MKQVTEQIVLEVIELSRLLGEFAQIKRVTLLPNGEQETDAYHSFSLALISYELAKEHAPQLDASKVLLYALVHDLPELITGDTVTLLASQEELERKAQHEAATFAKVRKKFAKAPHILAAIEVYEQKTEPETLFVYWVDKMITIPTHFYDEGKNLRDLGIKNRQDIRGWYERTLKKLQTGGEPHPSAEDVLRLAYQKMHDELLSES